MKDKEVSTLESNILFDLDTIRIEQTSFDELEKSYLVLKLLNEISENIKERFNETRQ